VAILVGQALGAGDLERAKDWTRKLIVTGIMSAILTGSIMFATSGLFPQMYNTNDQAREIATAFLMIQAVAMLKDSFLHCSYFALRSGGKTVITFLFDSVFMMVVSVPLAYFLSRYTNLSVIWIFALVHVADLIKCVIGYVLLKKGVWIRNIVKE
jgi:Na+-driven multidrug efflux pump